MTFYENENQIVEYLEESFGLSEKQQRLELEIEKMRENLTHLSEEQILQLNHYRARASRTIKGQEKPLLLWVQANQWMLEGLSQERLLNWEAVVELNNRLCGKSRIFDPVRKKSIYSGDSEFLPLNQLSSSLKNFKQLLKTEQRPLILAFQSYVNLVTIHPFCDGNGRTARMLADWVLIKNGYLPLVFPSPSRTIMAAVKKGPLRSKSEEYTKFLKVVLFSYQFLLNQEEKEARILSE